ncbi:MAG: SDR family NAD(P)-dependent oxidoreductase [Flavobacteriaceae bacterium]|nr:SDR family NAD(P)-dependent oxidoreductase [Flavobacteriaceae bacterium]
MKKVIIIGATSGIGKELANLFVANNYKVGITGRRTEFLEKLKAINPEKFIINSFDCTTENNSEKLTELVNKLGGLDLLIMSSGTGDENNNLDYREDEKTVNLNVKAFTEIMDWTFNYFRKQGFGHITAISSVAGLRGSEHAPAYFASKAYQINYLESLRKIAKKPIYITDIRPGYVDTAMALGDNLFWVSSKEKAAKQIFSAITNKKDVAYISKRWRLIAWALKLVPRFIYKRV